MGLYAHVTHLHLPEKGQARVVAGALLKSPHPLILSTPYGKWINVYLQMGLSYKDVPEFPTTPHVELNCYDGEGLDVRLYAQDRLAFLFESGCSEFAEQDERLLEIAAELWEADPNHPVASPASNPTGEEALPGPLKPTFWDLAPDQQEKYIAQANRSGEFKKVVAATTDSDELVPDPALFAPYLPEGNTLDDFRNLLAAISTRSYGEPTDSDQRAALQKWMGAAHSPKAEDYLRAVSRFLGLKGSLWSLESIQDNLADKIDRRIVPLDQLEADPPTS